MPTTIFGMKQVGQVAEEGQWYQVMRSAEPVIANQGVAAAPSVLTYDDLQAPEYSEHQAAVVSPPSNVNTSPVI